MKPDLYLVTICKNSKKTFHLKLYRMVHVKHFWNKLFKFSTVQKERTSCLLENDHLLKSTCKRIRVMYMIRKITKWMNVFHQMTDMKSKQKFTHLWVILYILVLIIEMSLFFIHCVDVERFENKILNTKPNQQLEEENAVHIPKPLTI